MIRMEDFGEVAYGGAVTLTEWWDNQRIKDGKLATKDVFKKASFYTYLGVGLTATLSSAFGWWRAQEKWMEHISHGFLYDMPRFTLNIVQSMGAGSRGTRSDAVRQAQEILQQRRTALPAATPKATDRSYQPEFATPNNVVF